MGRSRSQLSKLGALFLPILHFESSQSHKSSSSSFAYFADSFRIPVGCLLSLICSLKDLIHLDSSRVGNTHKYVRSEAFGFREP